MPNWREHTEQVILTGSPSEMPKSRIARIGASYERWEVPVFILFQFLLVIIVLLFASPNTYKVRQGELTYQAIPGKGETVFPLGPAGSVVFPTHKTPVTIRAGLVLSENVADGQTLDKIQTIGLREFREDAWQKFELFAIYKVSLLLVIGMLFGVTASFIGKYSLRRSARYTGIGALLITVLVSAFAGATTGTLNRSGQMVCTGLSKDLVTVVVNEFEKNKGSYQIPPGVFNDYSRGTVVETRHAKDLHRNPTTPSARVRILAGSDFQGNVEVGFTLFNSILNDGRWKPFDGVLLAGDLTEFGAEFEASDFAGKLQTGDKPIYMVGGNHEDVGAMSEFQKIGYQVINGRVFSIGGLRIFGISDPQAQTAGMNDNQELLKQSSQEAADMWASLGPDKPQVVLVHELDQASRIIELAKKEGIPLTVIFGHDHKVSVERQDNITLVGCGTGGASGNQGLGENPSTLYTFQVLDFSIGNNPQLLVVNTETYNGETRESTSTPTIFLD